jgi:hypothetical protein
LTVTVADGVITVNYGNDAHTVIAGNDLLLTPDTSAVGSVQWTCTGNGILPKHLPAACRP